MENIKDIQEILTALDNTTKEQLDKAIKNVDKEWSEMEMEEEKLNNLIYLLRIHHIDSEPLENLIKRNKDLEEENKKAKEISCTIMKDFIEKDVIPKSKVREKIEWLKTISDNGANAVRFAMTYEDEIERKQKQKDINTMISILEELQEGDK